MIEEYTIFRARPYGGAKVYYKLKNWGSSAQIHVPQASQWTTFVERKSMIEPIEKQEGENHDQD